MYSLVYHLLHYYLIDTVCISGPTSHLAVAAICYNGLASKNDDEELATLTGTLVEDHFTLLLQEMGEAGWDTECCMLGQGEWRYKWKTPPQGTGP